MEIQQIVLQTLRPNEKYTPDKVAELSKLTKQQASTALRRLWRGMILSREKAGRTYEYQTKQGQLPL